MDKKKQIEEVTKEVYDNSKYSAVMSHEIARYIVKNGYRKIPEGVVVLTKEEYSDYLVMKDAHQNAIEICEKLEGDNG